MTGQTITSVHNRETQQEERWLALSGDQAALSAFSMFTQMYIGLSLYLYENVGTPGYISILLTAPYALLLALAAKKMSKYGALSLLYGKRTVPGRVILLILSAINLIDAWLVLLSLCAVLQEVMPGKSLIRMSCAIAAFTALGLKDLNGFALPRLSGFIRWLVALLFIFCILYAIPCGKPDHFFPLLGYGGKSILTGALWMHGTVCGCVWPLLLTDESACVSILTRRRSILLKPVAAAYLAIIIIMLTSVWLLPVYAMVRRETLGWHLLLNTNMTPSIPAWSMEVTALFLMLFLTLHFSVQNAARLLCRFMDRKRASFPFLLVLAVLLVLPCAYGGDQMESTLLFLAPFRAILLPLALLLMLPGVLKSRKSMCEKGETAR